MKTKINNEEFKNYGDGSIAFKMRAKGVHYTLHFSKFTEHDVEVKYAKFSDAQS